MCVHNELPKTVEKKIHNKHMLSKCRYNSKVSTVAGSTQSFKEIDAPKLGNNEIENL